MGRDMKTERLYAYLYNLGGDVLLCFTLLFYFFFSVLPDLFIYVYCFCFVFCFCFFTVQLFSIVLRL